MQRSTSVIGFSENLPQSAPGAPALPKHVLQYINGPLNAARRISSTTPAVVESHGFGISGFSFNPISPDYVGSIVSQGFNAIRPQQSQGCFTNAAVVALTLDGVVLRNAADCRIVAIGDSINGHTRVKILEGNNIGQISGYFPWHTLEAAVGQNPVIAVMSTSVSWSYDQTLAERDISSLITAYHLDPHASSFSSCLALFSGLHENAIKDRFGDLADFVVVVGEKPTSPETQSIMGVCKGIGRDRAHSGHIAYNLAKAFRYLVTHSPQTAGSSADPTLNVGLEDKTQLIQAAIDQLDNLPAAQQPELNLKGQKEKFESLPTLGVSVSFDDIRTKLFSLGTYRITQEEQGLAVSVSLSFQNLRSFYQYANALNLGVNKNNVRYEADQLGTLHIRQLGLSVPDLVALTIGLPPNGKTGDLQMVAAAFVRPDDYTGKRNHPPLSPG